VTKRVQRGECAGSGRIGGSPCASVHRGERRGRRDRHRAWLLTDFNFEWTEGEPEEWPKSFSIRILSVLSVLCGKLLPPCCLIVHGMSWGFPWAAEGAAYLMAPGCREEPWRPSSVSSPRRSFQEDTVFRLHLENSLHLCFHPLIDHPAHELISGMDALIL
jgi:hypothetical protein